ncbi:MAG: LPS export ABC transporter periplasmic protein LptC [Gammaproteobacteria bacterium]|nr:LPS export ABC transporter periplasmic protein LptC [Gammaproteobacteria bacterium]
MLFLLVIFLAWFVISNYQEVINNDNQLIEILGTTDVPDYYSETLKLQQFNEQGALGSVINTARLIHYPGQQRALLESPEIVMYGIEGDTWEISSVTGSIADDNSYVILTDDVLLRLLNNAKQQTAMIKTDKLNYNVSEQILWTDSDIFAETEQGTFNAKGLKILISTEHIFLKEKVRIHYGS